MVAQIAAARHAIDFESEELSDAPVYQALAADARRGVACRILMMDSSEWDSAFRTLTRAGCAVRVLHQTASGLYIHEKLVLDDPGTAHESLLIGSQNASWESLHVNRELALVIGSANGGAAVIRHVGATFQGDLGAARPWR